MVPPKVSLLKLTQTDAIKNLYENNHVIQDMLVPMCTLKQSIELFHDAFQVWFSQKALLQHTSYVDTP